MKVSKIRLKHETIDKNLTEVLECLDFHFPNGWMVYESLPDGAIVVPLDLTKGIVLGGPNYNPVDCYPDGTRKTYYSPEKKHLNQYGYRHRKERCRQCGEWECDPEGVGHYRG